MLPTRRAPGLAGVPAPLLVLVSIVSVQTGSALARGIFDRTGAAGLTLLRVGISAAVLAVVVRPSVRGLDPAARRAAILFGLTLGGMNLAFYEAIALVPLGVAVTVEFVGPLAVALLGARRGLHVLWVALAAVGVVLLTSGDHGGGHLPVRGLAFAGLAGLLWACYILVTKRVGQLLPGTSGLALALPVATLLALPFGLSGAVDGIRADPVAVLATGLAVALLSSVICYGLELSALRRMGTMTFGILMSLEPAMAALTGLLLLGQRLTGLECVALVLVSAASLGVTLTAGDEAPEPPLS